MAFPQTPLPLRVKISPGADPAADATSWPPWVDITDKVRIEQGVSISDGRGDEAANVDAGQISMTMDNRTGDFVPANPLGPYYPLLRRNCPIRVGVDIAVDPFTRVTANGWGTVPDGPTWVHSGTLSDFSTDGSKALLSHSVPNLARIATLSTGNALNVEGYATVSISAVATGASMVTAAIARRAAVGDYYLFAIYWEVSGVASLRILRVRTTGSTFVANVPIPGGYTAGQTFRMHWYLNGSQMTMSVWPTSGSEPLTWMAGYNDGSAVVTQSSQNGMMLWRQGGSSNAGAVIFTVDDYRLESIEASGNVVEWPVRWDQSGRDSTAPIKAAGVLRRLQQGSTPLKSPLLRQLTGVSDSRVVPSAYWPLEDDDGTVVAASALPNGAPMSATDIAFGAATDLVSALQVAKLNSAASRLYGVARQRNGGTGFSAMWFFRYPGAITGSTDFVTIGATGRAVRIVLNVDSTGYTISGYDQDGVSVFSTPGAWGGDVNTTKWVAVQFETEVVGFNTNWSLLHHQVGLTTYWTSNGVYVSSVPASAVSLTFQGSAGIAGTFVAHAWLGQNTLPFVDDTFSLLSNGYIGEQAGDRFRRLLREEGIPGYVEPSPSEPMGPQRIDAIVPLLRSCAEADYGLMHESGFGLAMRPRSLRYWPTPTIILDRNQGHLSQPPEVTVDDQAIRNDWTVSRDGGAQGIRYFDAAHVAAEGRYDDSVTINVATDTVLPNHAAWRVFMGTRRELRWSQISLDLARNTSLINAWRGRVFGARMTVAGELAQVVGSPPDVIIEGTNQLLNAFSWDISTNTSPAKPWDAPTLDDPGLRLDTAGCVIDPAGGTVSAGATAITVVTTSGPIWAPTATMPGEVPFVVQFGGENWVVTNVGPLSGGKQVLTVSRAANGVVKAQPASTSGSLYQPSYVVL